jgi:uncharacterized protein YigA (DUF484 family)
MMSKTSKQGGLSKDEVREFLKKNPGFLQENPELVHELAPPARQLGDGVIDFQQFMVKNLQSTSRDLQGKYDLLVEYCRENMSAQTQVHHAALRLIAARNLEQLLEVVALDLVNVFDVDVVRLAMESEIIYETAYGEQNFSGIVFVEPGVVDAALGSKKVRLVANCEQEPPAGFAQLFADCDELIASCALLKLETQALDKQVLLAFGVRHAGRFHPGQGVELLHFLAQIVAFQLDRYLDDMSL